MIYVILDLVEARNKRDYIYLSRNHAVGDSHTPWACDPLNALTFPSYVQSLARIADTPALMERWGEATIGVSMWNDAEMKPQYLIDGSLVWSDQI